MSSCDNIVLIIVSSSTTAIAPSPFARAALQTWNSYQIRSSSIYIQTCKMFRISFQICLNCCQFNGGVENPRTVPIRTALRYYTSVVLHDFFQTQLLRFSLSKPESQSVMQPTIKLHKLWHVSNQLNLRPEKSLKELLFCFYTGSVQTV